MIECGFESRVPLFETLLSAENKADALAEAQAAFNRLPMRYQRHCEEVYIGCAEPLNSNAGGPDYDTMGEIEYIKK
jgi:hypothetical protein